MELCSIFNFHSEYYILEVVIFDFRFPFVYILGINHFEDKRNDMLVSWHNKFDFKFSHDYEERFQVLSEQVHSQYLSGCKSISIKGSFLEHFNKLKPSTIPMAKSHSHLSDKSDQDWQKSGIFYHF